MNDQATRGRATLTGSPHRTENNRGNGQFEIGIRCNDDGIVTTLLKDGLAQATGTCLGNTDSNPG